MISIIIVISILIINIIIIIVLNKNNISISNSLWLLLVAILIIFVGFTLIVWQENNIVQELNKRNWPTINGQIISAEIVGTRALRTEVNYIYEVDGKKYTGTSDYNIPGFGSKNYRRKNAGIIKNENPKGKQVLVYYKPGNPDMSTLRHGPYWSNYMILGFGSVLFLIGMLIGQWRIIKLFIK